MSKQKSSELLWGQGVRNLPELVTRWRHVGLGYEPAVLGIKVWTSSSKFYRQKEETGRIQRTVFSPLMC